MNLATKRQELNEKFSLNLIRFNEKLNNIVSERKRVDQKLNRDSSRSSISKNVSTNPK